MEAAKSLGMMLELLSELGGRHYLLRPSALGKVLELACQEGWQADRVLCAGDRDTSDTAIVLPHFGRYMPSRVSRVDAEGLRIALTKALATGTAAAVGSDQAAANTLLQVAREGAFRIRTVRAESSPKSPALSDELVS